MDNKSKKSKVDIKNNITDSKKDNINYNQVNLDNENINNNIHIKHFYNVVFGL